MERDRGEKAALVAELQKKADSQEAARPSAAGIVIVPRDTPEPNFGGAVPSGNDVIPSKIKPGEVVIIQRPDPYGDNFGVDSSR